MDYYSGIKRRELLIYYNRDEVQNNYVKGTPSMIPCYEIPGNSNESVVSKRYQWFHGAGERNRDVQEGGVTKGLFWSEGYVPYLDCSKASQL